MFVLTYVTLTYATKNKVKNEWHMENKQNEHK